MTAIPWALAKSHIVRAILSVQSQYLLRVHTQEALLCSSAYLLDPPLLACLAATLDLNDADAVVLTQYKGDFHIFV